jgi:rod shape-determining protein MreD
MRPSVYAVIALLLLPLQASLLAPLSRIGLAPDLGMAVLYTIGLLTTPLEATFAGIAIGLLQDLGSASLLGLSGLTLGIVGFLTGLLGQRVLDIKSPSSVVFLALFSLSGSLLTVLFLDLIYGGFPVLGPFFVRMVPRAAATTLAGYLIFRFATRRSVLPLIRRRELQKEH